MSARVLELPQLSPDTGVPDESTVWGERDGTARLIRRGLDARPVEAPRFGWRELCGRVSELSGEGASAVLTLGLQVVLDAQREGEPTAWVMVGEDGFFVPDAARAGIDLSALPVVRAPDAGRAGQAAYRLARSGAFGLVVVDVSRSANRFDPRIFLDQTASDVRLPTALLSRLVGLAQKHEMAVIFLSHKPAQHPSLDSLVSLRGDAGRGESVGNGRFGVRLSVHKDKRRGPCWGFEGHFVGPPGLW